MEDTVRVWRKASLAHIGAVRMEGTDVNQETGLGVMPTLERYFAHLLDLLSKINKSVREDLLQLK